METCDESHVHAYPPKNYSSKQRFQTLDQKKKILISERMLRVHYTSTDNSPHMIELDTTPHSPISKLLSPIAPLLTSFSKRPKVIKR